MEDNLKVIHMEDDPQKIQIKDDPNFDIHVLKLVVSLYFFFGKDGLARLSLI